MTCYLCAKTPATNPLDLSKSFTNHSAAKSPDSDKLCDRCYATIAGNQKQLYYWNPSRVEAAAKQKQSTQKKKVISPWSKMWGRSLTRLYQGNTLLCPTIEGEREGLQIVKDLATREQIRGWLLNPPDPPFTIAIATSGQKHILPFAIEALDREVFPVQFETESLTVNRVKFSGILSVFEKLMGLGFSKTEIITGDYRSDRIVQISDLAEFSQLNKFLEPHRGTLLLQLVEFVAQSPQ